MKRLKRALPALLLCVLLLGIAVVPAGGANDVYFMAVNETLVPMTAENMPIMVGDTLYVPYVMFSLSHNGGVNLGVTAQYSTVRRTVMVSQGQNVVIFDPVADTCYDLEGTALEARAVLRDSMAYIPLDWVCSYFGTIEYSVVRMAYGILIRVTDQLAVLDDEAFVAAAAEMLKENYRDYLNSGGSGGHPSQEDPVSSGRPGIGPEVYLAFLGAEHMERAARVLESEGRRGLFLFTVEELSREDELLRRLVGAGHLVGLDLVGSDAVSCLHQATVGAQMLASRIFTCLTVVRADGAPAELPDLLEESGLALWRADVRVEGSQSVSAVTAGLDREGPNFVELLCTEGTQRMVEQTLSELQGEGCRIRLAVAPALKE